MEKTKLSIVAIDNVLNFVETSLRDGYKISVKPKYCPDCKRIKSYFDIEIEKISE